MGFLDGLVPKRYESKYDRDREEDLQQQKEDREWKDNLQYEKEEKERAEENRLDELEDKKLLNAKEWYDKILNLWDTQFVFDQKKGEKPLNILKKNKELGKLNEEDIIKMKLYLSKINDLMKWWPDDWYMRKKNVEFVEECTLIIENYKIPDLFEEDLEEDLEEDDLI